MTGTISAPAIPSPASTAVSTGTLRWMAAAASQSPLSPRQPSGHHVQQHAGRARPVGHAGSPIRRGPPRAGRRPRCRPPGRRVPRREPRRAPGRRATCRGTRRSRSRSTSRPCPFARAPPRASPTSSAASGQSPPATADEIASSGRPWRLNHSAARRCRSRRSPAWHRTCPEYVGDQPVQVVPAARTVDRLHEEVRRRELGEHPLRCRRRPVRASARSAQTRSTVLIFCRKSTSSGACWSSTSRDQVAGHAVVVAGERGDGGVDVCRGRAGAARPGAARRPSPRSARPGAPPATARGRRAAARTARAASSARNARSLGPHLGHQPGQSQSRAAATVDPDVSSRAATAWAAVARSAGAVPRAPRARSPRAGCRVRERPVAPRGAGAVASLPGRVVDVAGVRSDTAQRRARFRAGHRHQRPGERVPEGARVVVAVIEAHPRRRTATGTGGHPRCGQQGLPPPGGRGDHRDRAVGAPRPGARAAVAGRPRGSRPV